MSQPKPPSQVPQSSGIVRSVNSGDSLSIYQTGKATPTVLEIGLSNVQAPRLGHGDNKDKPYAWQSREFLRKLCIGKKVIYKVENQTQNKAYGIVELEDNNTNLAEAVVGAGWADVRPPPEGKAPRSGLHADLIALNEAAKEEKKGIYQENQVNSERPSGKKLSTMELYEKFKGQTLDAIVEYVRDANNVTVILTDTGYKFTLKLAGGEAPSIPSKARQTAGEQIPPFAEEARFFVERHLLHRDVKIVITAPGEAGRQGEYYGTLFLAGRSLANQLIRNGFAKLIEWNAPKDQLSDLKAAQDQAKQQKLRIWKNYSEKVSSSGVKQNQESKEWEGRVREVRDGCLLVIERLSDSTSHQILLSNIKPPRLLKNVPTPYAYEAREALRSRAIGKKVKVVWDYTRNEKDFHTVFMEPRTSLAVILVERGFAKVVSFENCGRSEVYQQLTIAENRARAKNKNIWSPNADKGPVYRATDTTTRSNDAERKSSKQKAKQFLPSLQRAGRIPAIVENVYNAGRFKVSIPKENCIVVLALEAIRAPSTKPEDNDPWGKPASEFAYNKLFHRDVEIIINSLDKGGNFIGLLFHKSENFAISLLESGFAKVNQTIIDKSDFATEFQRAEQIAKNNRLRIWEKDVEPEPKETPLEPENKQIRFYNVTVSDIVSLSQFYLQITDDQAKLERMMSELNNTEHNFIPGFAPKRNEFCIAKYEEDNQWYRARVLKGDSERVTIRYCDYGNTAVVPISELRPLPAAFEPSKVAVQAKEAALAFVEIPQSIIEFSEQHAAEAALYFHSLVWDKPLLAAIEYTEGEKSFVRIGDGKQLVNVQMVEAGYAAVPRYIRSKSSRSTTLIQMLREKQAEARKNRLGMWEYGDMLDEDDE